MQPVKGLDELGGSLGSPNGHALAPGLEDRALHGGLEGSKHRIGIRRKSKCVRDRRRAPVHVVARERRSHLEPGDTPGASLSVQLIDERRACFLAGGQRRAVVCEREGHPAPGTEWALDLEYRQTGRYVARRILEGEREDTVPVAVCE